MPISYSSSAPESATPSRSEIRVVVAALMLVMLLSSLDQTIVSTALPTMVGELGGLEHLSWIVTAYILATTVVTPLYGKLGDIFGRKVVLQAAILIFLLGSALCGLSQSMGQLIAFRAIQGLGGGGLMISSMAAVGDIISPRERGRYQGWFGAVFGVSTVLGPLVGGFFVQHLSWRWIFYVNLPLGLLAFAAIGWVFHAPAPRAEPRIDWSGALLLAVALVSGILLASLGGQSFPWLSPAALALAALTVLALLAFLHVERRALEPILPPALFRNRTFVVASAVGFIVGVAMFGAVTYMPMYLQVVKGVDAARAGLQLTPMMGGVLLTSILSGQLISRSGRYKAFPIAGTALMAVGLLLLASLDSNTGAWTASGFLLVLGLGLGMVMQVLILAVQNAVDYRDLGVATSGATLFRFIGGSIGVAVFGAIFAARLARELVDHLPAGAALPAATDPASLAALPEALHTVYVEAFVVALQPVFLAACGAAVLGFGLAWLLREEPLRGSLQVAESLGDSFALPRHATSLEELESLLARFSSRERQWEVMQAIASRLRLGLQPDEIWLLIRVARSEAPLSLDAIAEQAAVPRPELTAPAERLVARGLAEVEPGGILLVTASGRRRFQEMVARYRSRLTEVVKRWSPEQHAEVKEMLTLFARGLVADLPRAPTAGP